MDWRTDIKLEKPVLEQMSAKQRVWFKIRHLFSWKGLLKEWSHAAYSYRVCHGEVKRWTEERATLRTRKVKGAGACTARIEHWQEQCDRFAEKLDALAIKIFD